VFHFGQLGVCVALLVPLAVVIGYYDVRYRRIPNGYVLVTLVCGLVANTIMGGWRGALSSLAGAGIAFCLMLILHLFGALGAGDVKLFASIGAVIGMKMVLPAFAFVVITGGALAVISIFRFGTVIESAQRISFIFFSMLATWRAPRLGMPSNRKQTIPYGVAITLGSLISLIVSRS
jgi:prepilin peptidase CpaA